jgi:hypothetical protein
MRTARELRDYLNQLSESELDFIVRLDGCDCVETLGGVEISTTWVWPRDPVTGELSPRYEVPCIFLIREDHV